MPTKESVNLKARRCVAAWVRYKMHRRKLNRQELGRLMGVAGPTVGRIVDEKRTAGLDFVLKFSEHFAVPLESLVYTMPPKTAADGTEVGQG